jgi:hypothetical protein
MIPLLVRRTLLDRPRRTLLLLLGFGIAVGVMIVLLSIGEAVLDAARDKDVVGGGDLVLLPEGVDIEVMKVGGATGMYFGIEPARFVYRQVLSGPRYADQVSTVPAPRWPDASEEPPPLAAASPTLANEVVYVRRVSGGPPRRALAFGVIPSLDRAVNGGLRQADGTPVDWRDAPEDLLWMDPPVDSLYHELDRFHRPPAGLRNPESWAEWLYFALTDPASGTAVFASFIVGGDVDSGTGRALPWLQIVRPGEPVERFTGDLPLGPGDVSYERCRLRFGARTGVRFEDGAWRLALDWDGDGGPVRGEIVVRPVADLYYPPFKIVESVDLVSGYAIPALRAWADGFIEAGGRRLVVRNAPAYHDHNWGTWRDVHWDWGTAAGPEHALVYGQVAHPALHPGSAGGLFVLLSRARREGRRGGFLGLWRPDSIAYRWVSPSGPLPGNPARVPAGVLLRVRDELRMQLEVEDVLSNPLRPGERDLVFLQVRGMWEVEVEPGGAAIRFGAPGFAETFVPARP